jgi:3-dehydroquinate dehydratase-2
VQVLVLNGPNLNLLGSREPEIYGTTTLRELEDKCRRWGKALRLTVTTAQSNHEGDLIEHLHNARGRYGGVVFNPGAYSHYSYALHDAIVAIELPVVEVHISDIAKREEWRRTSVVSPACLATINGKGVDGYQAALELIAAQQPE